MNNETKQSLKSDTAGNSHRDYTKALICCVVSNSKKLKTLENI